MGGHPFARLALIALCLVPAATLARDQSPAAPATAASTSAPVAIPLRQFAVEIQTGPNWDTSKPPQAQAFFKEHSAHLKQLRDAGRIRAGARYGDKGLLMLDAKDDTEARGWMEADPSIRAGTFRFTLHEMRVFYPGHIGPPKQP